VSAGGGPEPAGRFRRTARERADQRVSWERPDRAFFAAGACHILAWACRSAYPDAGIGLAGMRRPGETHVCHVYAVWREWTWLRSARATGTGCRTSSGAIPGAGRTTT